MHIACDPSHSFYFSVDFSNLLSSAFCGFAQQCRVSGSVCGTPGIKAGMRLPTVRQRAALTYWPGGTRRGWPAPARRRWASRRLP